MSPLVQRFALARLSGVGAAVAAVACQATGDLVARWFAVACIVLLLGSGTYWVVRLPRFALTGPLTRTEQLLQSGALFVAAVLGAAAWRDSSSPVAVVATAVASLAGAAAPRRRDIVFADVAAAGVCLLVLASGPRLVQAPLILLTWALVLVSVATAVGLAMLDSRAEPLPTTAGRLTLPPARSLGVLAAPFAASLIVGLVTVLIFPFDDGDSGPAGGGGSFSGHGSTSRNQTFGGPMDLRARGSLGTREVAVVDAAAPDHWRTQVLSRYDGSTFYPDAGAVTGTARQTEDGTEVSALESNGTSAGATDRAFWIRPATTGLPLMAPGHLQRVNLPVTSLRTGHGGLLLPTTASSSYTVSVALPPAATEVTRDRAASGAIAGESPTDAQWLDLPGTVTARTRALAAQLTAGRTRTADKVAAVHAYLQSHYTYNLDSPVAPAGHDAVDDFLFESRTGFCEHFAAAETVLLRSVGVPARVAVGFAFGDVSAGGRRFTQKDSHAWTEVYEPGYGWLLDDSTASAQTGTKSGITARLHAWFERLRSHPRQRAVAVAVLIGLGVAGTGLTRWVSQRRRRRARRRTETRTELQRAADRLLQALEVAGRPGRPNETVRALAARVPQAAAGLEVLERAAYGRGPVGEAETAQAVRIIDEAARGIREEAPRRRRSRA